jgi:hypothetical protein
MKRQKVLALCVGIALCGVSFCFGRLSVSQNVITYSVNGWPTSFNRAWPTYGLPLAEDAGLLTMLRAGNSTNAVEWLETMLDTLRDIVNSFQGLLILQRTDWLALRRSNSKN